MSHGQNFAPLPQPHSLIHLDDRGLLAISGPDARAFLQGMVTCNMDKLTADQALFGAHLTSQGRLLDPFFVYELEGKIVLDCARERVMPLAKSLHGYQMRFDIEFEDLTEDYFIYADITAHSRPLGEATPTENGVAIADPRAEVMGMRYILKAAVEGAQTLEAYEAHRLNVGMPNAQDFTREKTIAGEYCLEYQNGVDYKKGCYIGQEMTARTHFRTQPKRRVIAVTYEGIAPECGTDLMDGNLKVGTVYSCAGGRGIAIARIAKALHKDADLTADGHHLKAEKPAWANYDIES